METMRRELRSSNEKLAAAQSKELEIRTTYSSAEHELIQCKRMVEWCNSELQRKNDSFTDYRKEKNTQLEKLQLACESISQEKSVIEMRSNSIQSHASSLEKKVQEMLERIQEAENRNILAEQQFKNEMNSHKKLTSLYENKSNELAAHNAELEGLVCELEEKIVAQSEQIMNSQSEMTFHYEEIQRFADEQSQRADQLESELAAINQATAQADRTSQLGELSETAASASRLQKSGKTFTQVYAEYTKIQGELLIEKSETTRLSECLKHIVAEIAERGPDIQKTKVDLEAAKAHNQKLSNQLAVVVNERNDSTEKFQQLQAQTDAFSQEKTFLEKDIKDMSRQIHALLRQLESVAPSRNLSQFSETRMLSKLSDNIDEGLGVDSSDSPAEALIAERLVVFRNIEELQNQNQSLRRSLRSLSHKMEAHEKSHEHQVNDDHIKEMLEASKVIEELQSQLKIQSVKVESYSREKDQWKQIAERRGSPSPRITNRTMLLEEPHSESIAESTEKLELLSVCHI